MKACMVENGMHFDEKEVSDLATALFEDAVQVSIIFNTCKHSCYLLNAKGAKFLLSSNYTNSKILL